MIDQNLKEMRDEIVFFVCGMSLSCMAIYTKFCIGVFWSFNMIVLVQESTKRYKVQKKKDV